MTYYIAKTVKGTPDEVEAKVRGLLQEQGFGVLTYIDVQSTLKAKLNADIPAYRILGACNPPFAHKAIMTESRIGTMLPCNVVVQDVGNGEVEVTAVDPVASMMAIDNAELKDIAGAIKEKLMHVLEGL